jgi:flagellar hook-associated protein 3 FlgL
MVTSLTSLRDSLMYSANTVDQEGRYVFSGTATSTPSDQLRCQCGHGLALHLHRQHQRAKVVVGNGITQTATDVSGLESLLNQMDTTIAELSQPGVSPSTTRPAGRAEPIWTAPSSTLDFVSGKIAVLGGAQNIMARSTATTPTSACRTRSNLSLFNIL